MNKMRAWMVQGAIEQAIDRLSIQPRKRTREKRLCTIESVGHLSRQTDNGIRFATVGFCCRSEKESRRLCKCLRRWCNCLLHGAVQRIARGIAGGVARGRGLPVAFDCCAAPTQKIKQCLHIGVREPAIVIEVANRQQVRIGNAGRPQFPFL